MCFENESNRQMSKQRTVIASIGSHGEKIVNKLNKHGLQEADFMTHNELIKDSSKNIFILFIVYCPKDNCIKKVDKVAKLYTNKTVIEIIITDRIERKNPHYIINNLSIHDATKEISTLIKAFTDLGKFPSQACIDMADIVDSLKNVGKLRMKEFTFEANGDYNAFSKLFVSLRTTKKIKTIWLQVYLHSDDGLLYIVLEKLLDAVSSSLDSKTEILWNVSYGEPILEDEKFECVMVFC